MKKKKRCPKCGIEAEEGSYAYRRGNCIYCGIPLEEVKK